MTTRRPGGSDYSGIDSTKTTRTRAEGTPVAFETASRIVSPCGGGATFEGTTRTTNSSPASVNPPDTFQETIPGMAPNASSARACFSARRSIRRIGSSLLPPAHEETVRRRNPTAVAALAALMAFVVVPITAPAGEAAAGAGAEAPRIQVNFEDMPLKNLIHQVGRITGRSFAFKDEEVQRVKVSLSSDKQVSPDEFLRIFETLLQMHAMTVVPAKESGIQLVKIVPESKALQEPGDTPVLTKGDPVPARERFVTWVTSIDHTDPQRVIQAIQPLAGQGSPILLVQGTNLLMISGYGSSIARVQKVINLLDTPGEKIVTAYHPLKNVSAVEMQGKVQNLLSATKRARGLSSAAQEEISVLTDERLNLLILVGRERAVEEAKKVVSELDQEIPQARRTVEYYRLRNVDVKDILGPVTALLGVGPVFVEQPPAEGATGAAPAPAAGATPPGTLTPGQPGVPPGAVAPPAAAPTALPSRPSVPSYLQNILAKRPEDATIVIPHEKMNILIVAGDSSVHSRVKTLLEKLDVRKPMVLLETAIVQITSSVSDDTSVEVLVNDQAGRAQLNAGSGFGIASQDDPRGIGFPEVLSLAGFTGGAARFARSDLQVILRVLETNSKVRIISKPQLLVNEHEPASFSTSVAEPTTTVSQGTATTNTAFGGFQNATTRLQITPHVSPDDWIHLEIQQDFEEFTGTSSGAGIPPPKVSNNLTTKVNVPRGRTVILGGFTRESDDVRVSGVPILKDIPLLGALFRSTSESKKRSVLYLFVQPKILRDPDFKDLEDETRKREGRAREAAKTDPKYDEWLLDKDEDEDASASDPAPAPERNGGL